ncbi:hypothetical protein C8Q75DRAFT_723428 [Abortiporus biennis]|nr:hypothetical protein C8Q75DRAFT_723428 [Abortiporus biennis]
MTTVPLQRPNTNPQSVSRPFVADDYEKWYTEPYSNNRMVMSLKSGIDKEIAWALDRLSRLSNNDRFVLTEIPGLTESLFEWPVWYVSGGAEEINQRAALFALDAFWERRQRHALESIFVLRNAAMNEKNTRMLASHPRTRPMILFALHRLHPNTDATAEFIQSVIDMFLPMAEELLLPHPTMLPLLSNPIPPLEHFTLSSKNRNIIISSFATLTLLLSNPGNVAHLKPDSEALEGAIQYLPLLQDKPLVEACLNYLYAHLAHPPMTKAFLLHPRMAATLKLLVSVLLSEQVEENVSVDISGPIHTAPSVIVKTRNHDITKEELDSLLTMTEPQRCYQWMKYMFVPNPSGEITQVDLWNMYKDLFTQYAERCPPLAASDVIKNMSAVFPQAQAMVLPGPPQRFVVCGIERRKDEVASDRFRCHWNHSQCISPEFNSTGELYEHILASHVNTEAGSSLSCSWATCQHEPMPKAVIRGHILTHLPIVQPPARHPSQSENITLPSQNYPHPVAEPTKRPPPPARSVLTYPQPVVDPPSSALTALLCIRVLFRAAFASSDTAPRADEDHFGFPGVIEESEDDGEEERNTGTDAEREGERRGRKAFIGIRHMLEGVRIKDDTLMSWIDEMIDAGIMGTT